MLRSRSTLALGVLLLAGPLRAQTAPPPPPPPKPPPPVTGTDLARTAGVLVLGGLAYLVDDKARDAFRGDAGNDAAPVRALSAVGDQYGSYAILGASVLLYGVGLATDRPVMATTGFRAIEAIGVAGAIAWTLKEVNGRARPDVPPHEKGDWRVLKAHCGGGDCHSMPSGHATVAFAFATAASGVLAAQYPGRRGLIYGSAYGLATLTAWQRMHEDRHWLSDVTIGAGIGTVTALAVNRWHRTRPDNAIDRFFLRGVVAPTAGGGMSLRFSLLPP